MAVPASSAASNVVYEPFVCRSTCRRNRPTSATLRCVGSSCTASSKSGFTVIVLLAGRGAIFVLLKLVGNTEHEAGLDGAFRAKCVGTPYEKQAAGPRPNVSN